MKYTKYILSIVIPFGLLYLVGCAVFISFSLIEWSFKGRVLIFGFSSLISIYLLIHNLALEMAEITNIEVIDPETVEYDK
jgi:hypothetical protein